VSRKASGGGDKQAKRPVRALSGRPRVKGRDVQQPRSDEGWDLDPVEGAGVDGAVDPALVELASLTRRQLTLLGEDADREGLRKTPLRVATSLAWLTRGYGQSVESVVGDALFEEEHQHMVMVRDIEFYSLCEHHLLPFFGRVHVAYIPDGRIVGLSKLPRIVEVFARRLQVQERLTEEIACAIDDVLEPAGVGVVVEAVHLCMMMRGVEKQRSKTITSALRGTFRSDSKTRSEFLRLAHDPAPLF
jgi:GTP cyclohydrolase IA